MKIIILLFINALFLSTSLISQNLSYNIFSEVETRIVTTESFSYGNSRTTNQNNYSILADIRTGVQYLKVGSLADFTVTPLLNEDGKPIIIDAVDLIPFVLKDIEARIQQNNELIENQYVDEEVKEILVEGIERLNILKREIESID